MRALIIGDDERRRIAEVVARAKRHPFDLETMERGLRATGAALARWKRELLRYTIALPIGYTVTYTREEQPCGLCHHISISVDAPKLMPNPAAIGMICTAFGMLDQDGERKMQIVATWPEEYPSGHIAANIVALVV